CLDVSPGPHLIGDGRTPPQVVHACSLMSISTEILDSRSQESTLNAAPLLCSRATVRVLGIRVWLALSCLLTPPAWRHSIAGRRWARRKREGQASMTAANTHVCNCPQLPNSSMARVDMPPPNQANVTFKRAQRSETAPVATTGQLAQAVRSL